MSDVKDIAKDLEKVEISKLKFKKNLMIECTLIVEYFQNKRSSFVFI